MPKINDEEYEILKGLGSEWKWIARDENLNRLMVYRNKPIKSKFQWIDKYYKELIASYFRFIQWEDNEPYSIAELIEEYELACLSKNLQRVLDVLNNSAKEMNENFRRLFASGYREHQETIELLTEEEAEVKKDKQWLINKVENYIPLHDKTVGDVVDGMLELVNQLDEQETLSPEWIDEHQGEVLDEDEGVRFNAVPVDDLKDILVPKQDTENEAFRRGFKQGEQQTEELYESTEEQPKTVARVIFEYMKAAQQFKEILGMEVEELEE